MNYVSHFTVVCTYWFILNTYCILLLIGCPTKMPGKCRLHMLFGQRGVPCKREMSLNSWLLRYHIELQSLCFIPNVLVQMKQWEDDWIHGLPIFPLNYFFLGCSIQKGAKGKLYRCNPEIKFGEDPTPRTSLDSLSKALNLLLLEIFFVHVLAIINSMPLPH